MNRVIQMNATQALKIKTYPDDFLKTTAHVVDTFDASLHEIIDAMFITMNESMGLGLAGPQVGVDKRIIVVDVDRIDALPERNDCVSHGKFALVNPEIIHSSNATATMKEGCLSVPGASADVKRAEAVIVRFYDRFGEKHTIETCGLLARCIQHEIDHLNGTLFIDKLSKLKRDILLKKLKKTAITVNQ